MISSQNIEIKYIGYCENCGSGVKKGSEAVRNWKGKIVRCINCIGKGQPDNQKQIDEDNNNKVI